MIEASRVAQAIGLSEADAQMVATAVSELARNILKYADEGDIWIEQVHEGRQVGIRVDARDRGPGIADLDAAMSDHFSSSGTLGLGLPGVKRMMDEFEIGSSPEDGTRVVAVKWRDPPARPARRAVTTGRARPSAEPAAEDATTTQERRLDCAVFVRPCRGERVSGDAAIVERRDHLTLLAIVDALGHGPSAHEVARKAEEFLRGAWTSDVVATMQRLHEALTDTLGAAAGLAVVDRISGSLRYTGVGNTVLRSFGARELRLVSTAGTLGHQIRTPQEHHIQLTEADVAVLYTDGIKDRFELKDYPQLRYQSAAKIARTLVDRFGKPHDDAGCIVLRHQR